MRLLTDTYIWDEDGFENSIEGVCSQLLSYPYERVAFMATPSPETVFLFFAIWKLGKIACPLNHRFSAVDPFLARLGVPLFTPEMVIPQKARAWEWKEKNEATLLFTSGTTATPKIACHTIGNHLASAEGSQEIIPLHPSDTWHLSLPLHHVGGISILFRSYLAKSSILLSEDPTKATHLSLVPTQFYRMKKNPPFLPHLKLILMGGAALPQILNEPWKILPTYGMTEMSSQIATGGVPLKYTQLKLAEDGEILVKGKTLFQGYFSLNEPLYLPLDEKGWFATKDVGKWDPQGRLDVIGRKDNLFISGGENIQPEEIEQLLKSRLQLEEAIVIPKEDAEWGHRPVVFIRPFVTKEEIKQALQGHVPTYKIPIESYPIPKEMGLKISRKELGRVVN